MSTSTVTDTSLDPEALAAELEKLRPLAEMGRMAATVAHEIRNPLTGISANAELLRETLRDPGDIESVDMILAEVHRLGHLVSDLLYYSRERQAERKPIDLAWLARSACELSQPLAAKQGVAVAWEGSGCASGDLDLARQALLNVLRNAIQACPRGGSVTLRIEDARIDVADTGCGVPEALRPSLFEPFVTGRTRGLGLGATVAKRCQERQGGTLALVSTGTSGSVFRLAWG